MFGAVAFVALSIVACHLPWGGGAEFVGRLRCGMLLAEVESIAKAVGSHDFACGSPDRRTTECTLRKGGTVIFLHFEGKALRSVEEGQRRGLMGLSLKPKVNLCTGDKTRRVVIEAGKEWNDAVILVDGRRLGTITAPKAEPIEVPLGSHQIQIIPKAGTPISRRIDLKEGLEEPQRFVLANK